MDGMITDVGKHKPRHRRAGRGRLICRLRPHLGAALVTVAAVSVALVIHRHLAVANVALVFVGAVVLCATRWGLMPALLACVLSVLSMNFFFLPPIHELAVKDPENVVAVLVFLSVAVFVGRLTARARADATLAKRRAEVTKELYAFARKLTGIDDLDELVGFTVRQLAETFDMGVVLLLADREELVLRAALPPIESLDAADAILAEECWRQQDQMPDGTAACRFLFLPLRAVNGRVGVLGLSRNHCAPEFDADDRRFVEAMADQVAIAIQRLVLAAEMQRARVAAETETLRSAMLSAISHDLRTPLASILGAATSLGSYSSYFEQQERDDLVATIREEAERMSRFVTNLLDITRVESGMLEVRADVTDVEEVIGAAARRARRVLGGRQLTLRVAPELPMLTIDGVLLEQTLFNLLDNAAKYSPPRSNIAIEAMLMNDRVLIKVIDEGPGIHPQDVYRIFEKFYRSTQGRRQRAGTGLGLAICHGFVEAMGGRIIAGNRTDRSGAVFMIGFPRPKEGVAPPVPLVEDD